jgi:hypothetical protein
MTSSKPMPAREVIEAAEHIMLGLREEGYEIVPIGYAREAVAAWMMARGYATGHGDTIDDLLIAFQAQCRDEERDALGGEQRAFRSPPLKAQRKSRPRRPYPQKNPHPSPTSMPASPYSRPARIA